MPVLAGCTGLPCCFRSNPQAFCSGWSGFLSVCPGRLWPTVSAVSDRLAVVRSSVAQGLRACLLILGAGVGWAGLRAAGQPAPITIDYPEQGSIFPPEITPPAFLWRDPVEGAAVWRIEIKFAGGAPVRAQSRGERLPIGEIETRAVAETNQPPKWHPQIAAARSWTPDTQIWETIKKRSVKRPATVTITGYLGEKSKRAVSRGQITIQTSKDPVGAPIFYRDVPLMPSESRRA